MSDQPDLFSTDPAETTCGQCGSFLCLLSNPTRHYCGMSFQDASSEDQACRYYEERR